MSWAKKAIFLAALTIFFTLASGQSNSDSGFGDGTNPNAFDPADGQEQLDQGFSNSPNSGGGFDEMDFRLGFEQGIGGIDAESYVRQLVFAGMVKQLPRLRKDLDFKEMCLQDNSTPLVDALVEYYENNSQVATRICENRRAEAATCESPQDFGANFDMLKHAPRNVQDELRALGYDRIDLSEKSYDEMKNIVNQVCLAMTEKEFSKQNERMEREIDRAVERMQSECDRFKQQEQQREQWEQQDQERRDQWQNQSPQSGYGGQQQCPFGSHFDPSRNTCVPDGGQQPYGGSQPPAGGCGPDQYWNGQSCQSNQNNYVPPSQPSCPEGTYWDGQTCQSNQTSPPTQEPYVPPSEPSPSGDGSGGGLAAVNILNGIFGQRLYPLLGFFGLNLQDQPPQEPFYNPSSGYGSDQGFGGSNYDHPPEGFEQGSNYGSGPQSQPQDYGAQRQGGYNSGPGFGGMDFESICASGDIRSAIEQEMGGQSDGRKEEMQSRCARESEIRASEMSRMVEQFTVQKELWEARQVEACEFKSEVAAACESTLSNVRQTAEELIGFKCNIYKLKEARESERTKTNSLALELIELGEDAGTEIEYSTSAAAEKIMETEEQRTQALSNAGFLGSILPNAEKARAHAEAAKVLKEKARTLEDLQEQQLDDEKIDKIKELKEELESQTRIAEQCEGAANGFLSFLSGC